LRLMLRADAILDCYTHYDGPLSRIQAELRASSRAIYRALRRSLIRRSLTCSVEEFPKLMQTLQQHVDDEYQADFDLAERSLSEGTRIMFDDLKSGAGKRGHNAA